MPNGFETAFTIQLKALIFQMYIVFISDERSLILLYETFTVNVYFLAKSIISLNEKLTRTLIFTKLRKDSVF